MRTQTDIENENLGLMIEKNTEAYNKFQKIGNVSEFSMSAHILPWYVAELADKLNIYKQEILLGKAKRKAIPAKVLTLIDERIVAHYVVKMVINTFGTKDTRVVPVANRIANYLDTEVRLDKADTLKDYIARSSHRGERRLTLARDLMAKYHKEVMEDKDINFLKLGLLGVAMLAECQPIIDNKIAPPIFSLENITTGIDSKTVIVPMPWFSAWIEEKLANGELISAYHTAMIEPPIDWKHTHGGGFHTERFKYNLIRNDVDPELYRGADMFKTLSAINRLQSTPWKINNRVLEVMEYAMDEDKRWGDLPYNKKVDKPPYPFPDRLVSSLSDVETKTLKEWRAISEHEYDEKVSEDSKYMTLFRIISEANRFLEYDKIYFAYFLDFRGRAYPVASNLQPQGTDYTKALLCFSEGKPILDMDSEMFLAMHGANTYGNDKETFINKHKWVLENESSIIESANNPMATGAFWQGATGEPWQFLAFCFEWADYRKYGKNFKSHIAVAVDGSCNGLQHLSAILMDEVGGKAVNIIDNTIKGDIYNEVRLVAISLLQASEDPMAKKILEFGITRKAVKRPVMIVPYAGTQRACKAYLIAEVNATGGKQFFGEDFKECMSLYSSTVWEAINNVIIKGREVMDFLGDSAKEIIKHTKSTTISWTTPNGFRVIQKRLKKEKLNIETPMGQIVKTKSFRSYLEIPTKTTDARKHATAIAPNFIHSLDSCHLQNTVNAMPEGSSFAMIHDSYGTHASDSRALYDALRMQFYLLYKDKNILESWLSQQPSIPLPFVPSYGKLDLKKVLTSDHFFS